jgi:hypothetical protein
MKILILMGVIFLPILAWAQPSIMVEADSYDFGVVKQGAQLEYSFQFSNTGTEDLVVEKLIPS